MKDISLSKRMEAVVKMISPQSFAIADVGCDHAYVSIALKLRGMAQKVIAMDVRKGPLAIAEKNIALYGLEESIDVRLGDGLEKLNPGEADAIVIAGMGGLLMRDILERGKRIWCEKEHPVLILQPQSDLDVVRHFLYEHGYVIERENMLTEDGKYYTVMRAAFCPEESMMEYNDAEWLYGAYNLRHKNGILLQYLQDQSATLQRIDEELQKTVADAEKRGTVVAAKTRQRMLTVRQQIRINEKAQQYYRE